ncbi:hypothetical protein BGZ83_005880, partial [Gryganskiella cystojenkinii]
MTASSLRTQSQVLGRSGLEDRKTTAELLETRARQLQSSMWLREIAGVCLDNNRRKNKELFDDTHRIREKALEVGSLVLM